MTNQEFKVASDFFKLTVADPASRWGQSARYNLGRAYEAMGIQNQDNQLLQMAMTLYEEDHGSPQQTGNLWRVKNLKALLQETPSEN